MTDLPSEGGSYIRDPKTGELVRQPDEAPAQPDPDAAPDPATATPEPTRKGGK